MLAVGDRIARAMALAAVALAGLSLPPAAASDAPIVVASLDAAHLRRPSAMPDQGSQHSRNVLRLVNEYRARKGLAALQAEDSLQHLADRHSRAMAARGMISHDGFRDRFERTPGRICVENVGANFRNVEELLDAWRGSPAHHRNLLEPRILRVGVAATGTYVTFFACG